MKRLSLIFLVIGVFFLGLKAYGAECGNCFEDAAPYVQLNYQPEIDWGAENVNVCPGGTVSYHPGTPLRLSYGLWDNCEERRGEPQKVCGEFFIVVADESLQNFLYYSQGSWHFTTSIEEIRPYKVVGAEGEPPFVWHFYLSEGANLPSGIYYLIAFVDKVQDNKPTLSPGDYKYCLLNVFIP